MPVLLKLKVRNLYLIQGLTYKQISADTGLTVECIEKLACRNGWTKLRREAINRAISKQDSHIAELQDETIAAIASASEQHALSGLERVGEVLAEGGQFAARDFQAYTGGVRNLVSVMRDLRTPLEQKTAGTTLNMFIMRAGDVAPLAAPAPEVNVTPVSTQALPVVAAPPQ